MQQQLCSTQCTCPQQLSCARLLVCAQVVVDAIVNRCGQHAAQRDPQLLTHGMPCHCSGPREDATRIGSAGVVRRQAVDVSPLRRVNQVLF
jgi:ribosomal protein S7